METVLKATVRGSCDDSIWTLVCAPDVVWGHEETGRERVLCAVALQGVSSG